LEELAEITDKKIYKKHAHVYERGDAAKHLFVVSKGLISLSRFDLGDQVGQHYTLTAVCIEDSEVMAIDADKLSDLCEKDPAVGYKLMLEIAQVYFERYKSAKRNLHEMVRTPTLITALPG